MNYVRAEMANGKSDGTEVPFRCRMRTPARRGWAVHLWVAILSLPSGTGCRLEPWAAAQKHVPAESAAGDSSVSDCAVCAVFDPKGHALRCPTAGISLMRRRPIRPRVVRLS